MKSPPIANQPLNLRYRAVGDLKPYVNNPRTHSKAQIRQIANSIKEFGFTNPLLIDNDAGVIAGHGRLEAAKLLKMTEVPTIRLSELSEAQKRAYILADNRLAEVAGWDTEILAIELQALVDLDFDIELTGFEIPDIDNLLSANGDGDASEEDSFEPPAQDAIPVTRPGDLWVLGHHSLLCADATQPESYARLLGNRKAQMVFTDPPYNVPIDRHVCGKGQFKHREFAMASGEMTPAAFTRFLQQACQAMARHSQAGSLHFICMDWRHMPELLAAADGVYSELKNLCVWNKDNGGMGSLYRSKHELIFVFKQGTAPHINNVELGKHGRNRTNVWDYPGVNSFKTALKDSLALHPTVKPVALVADALLDCSKPRGLILDPFGGSGTTLLAAHKTRRSAALMELDPLYCDVIIRRYQDLTGQDAIHAETRQTFTEHHAQLTETEETDHE